METTLAEVVCEYVESKKSKNLNGALVVVW
jgi:hypothetical protein